MQEFFELNEQNEQKSALQSHALDLKETVKGRKDMRIIIYTL